METVSLYRLHTDALDEQTLKDIADRIHKTNPNQEIFIYDIERDEDEIQDLICANALHEKHEPECQCGQCTGEDRAIEQMEKGIVKAETDYEGENFR